MATKENNSAKEAIRAYLDHRAATDEQFAAVFAKPGKNLDECFDYILGEARKRGNAVCMTDEEVLGLAVHYYDEDDLKVTPVRTGYRASASKAPDVELTEEEKKAAREKAIALYEQQCIEEEARKEAERKKKEAEKAKERKAAIAAASPSLFDDLL